MINDLIIEKCVDARHKLHQIAELSNEEKKTKKFLMDFLSENTRFEIHDEGEWFYAVYKSGSKRKIALRSEIDAVPVTENNEISYKSLTEGVSHACGHDGHCAAMLSTALHIEKEGAPCDVYFLFQHAEETGEGAVKCLKLFEDNDVNEIYGCHNAPGIPFGKIVMNEKGLMHWASTGIILNFEGAPSHASMPELGINPAFCIAEIIRELSCMEKESSHEGPVLSTIINIDVGEDAFGVQASTGKLCITVRGEVERDIERFKDILEYAVKKKSELYSLRYNVGYKDNFPITLNSRQCMEIVENVCKGIDYDFEYTKEMDRGSEDFGWYTKRIPGAIFHIGAGTEHAGLHTSEFDFPDELIKNITEIFMKIINNRR